MNKLSLVLIISCLLVVNGCGKKCEKCDLALDHLYGKLAQNNCNPNNMFQAVQRIAEDCDDPSSAKIGYMAESCDLGANQYAGCETPQSILSLPFDLLVHTNSTFPDDIELVMYTKSTQPSASDRVANFSANQTGYKFILFDDTDNFGDGFQDEVYDVELYRKYIGTGGALEVELLLNTSRRFTFSRSSSVVDREIDIEFINSTSEYSLEFINW